MALNNYKIVNLNIDSDGSLSTSGAYDITLTVTASTNVTLPTSGTLAVTDSPTFTTSVNLGYATASELLSTDGSKNLVSLPVATYPSLTEIAYVKGVTSAIQTQIDSKQKSITNNSVSDGTVAGQLKIWDNATSQWDNAVLTEGLNVTITNSDGSITIASNGSAFTEYTTNRVTTSTGLVAGNDTINILNSSGGAITPTLSASPTDGLLYNIIIVDDTNTIEISGNGNNILDNSGNLTGLKKYDGFTIFWDNTQSSYYIDSEIAKSIGGNGSGLINTILSMNAETFSYPKTGITQPFSNASNSPNIEFDVDNYNAEVALISTSSNEPMQFNKKPVIPSGVSNFKFIITYEPENGQTWNSESIVWKGEAKNTTDNTSWSTITSFTIGTDTAPSSGSNPLVFESTVSLATMGLAVGDTFQMTIYVDSTSTWANDIAFESCQVEAL